MSRTLRKIAFVIPWFGSSGGAEAFCAGLARNLAELGREVEVLTTCCASSFRDWGENHLPPGESREQGFIIRRFPVRRRDASLYAHYSGVIDRGGTLTRDQERELLENSINSDALYEHITQHRDEYHFFFLPYLYGTTLFGMQAAPVENAHVIPCLHNEAFAYLPAMQEMFRRASGALFLSEPERNFATTLYDLSAARIALIGGGVSASIRGQAERFRQQSGIAGRFILFVGRKVPGKGADLLLKYFADYAPQASPGVRLVLLGPGEIDVPAPISDRVISTNAETAQQIFDAMAASEFLVQPSFFESFSLVLMEAWLSGAPVLVNGECEVTLHHVLQSNGGLYFTSYGEFAETANLLLSDAILRRQLAAAGRDYVLANWTWPDTLRRFQNYVAELERGQES
jgi:glycosyltransferase involved in cell wall biosynthesis